MKKTSTLFIVLGFISLVACGPSAEEKAKMEAEAKVKMDSLFNPVDDISSSKPIAVPADSAKAE